MIIKKNSVKHISCIFFRITEIVPSSDIATTVSLSSGKPTRTRNPISQPGRYKELGERLKSFEGVPWPEHLDATPDKLAKAGFYYVGPGDKVKCGYCGAKIKSWKPKDSAIEQHIEKFPQCSFVQNVEEQTKVLSKNIRAKSKTANYTTAEALKKEHEEKQAKLKVSSGSKLKKK